MDVGVARTCGDRLEQDWTLRLAGEFLDKRQIFLDMTSGLRDLDETLVARAQDTREIQDVLVAHRVGHHRRAVEIRLRRMLAEALYREAAEAGIHAFIQEPSHLVPFRFGCRTSFRAVQTHDVGH